MTCPGREGVSIDVAWREIKTTSQNGHSKRGTPKWDHETLREMAPWDFHER